MNPEDKKSAASKLRLAYYIRLTPKEHERVERDVRISGRRAQALFKKAYFDSEPVTILMTDQDKSHFFAQIHRIGNNVNQIARQLNSGFAFGFQQELETIRAQLTLLTTWVSSKYRNHKI